jgi:hypothetical protein
MIFNFLLFILLSFYCFTVPGIYFLRLGKINFSLLEELTLGSILGFVVFTLFSYIFFILHASFLIFVLVLIADFLFLRKFRVNKLIYKKSLFLIILIFILGILGQLAITAPSGTKINNDLIFYSANGHDGAWHISLMEEMKKGYPLQNPSFAGERLVNYHFFSDITPSQFSKFFGFSNLDLYFRFFPFLYSLMIGAIAYLLGKKLSTSFLGGLWLVFFIYFSGSFGFIVTFLKDHTLGGESIFWATQIQSSIGNPPQIISNILVLTLIYLLIFLMLRKNLVLYVLTAITLGSLIEFKVYASLVFLAALGLVGLVTLIKNKSLYVLSLVFFGGLISSILYLPNTANSASFLIFEPWWFIRTMIVVDSRLNWIDLELRRQTYLQEHNIKRVIQLELTGFLIFFFGNLGTKSIGIIFFLGSFRKIFKDQISLLILSISLISLILPLLFLQKGVASNTIQFLQYFLLTFAIFSSLTLTKSFQWFRNIYIKIFLITLVIIFSIPTQIGLLYDFYHKPPLAKITSNEADALFFLKTYSQPDNVILTPPYDKDFNLKIATPPIWAWFDTSYVSAFSSRRTYLSDIEQVDIMGYEYKKRLTIQKSIFESKNPKQVIEMLKQTRIDYIYFPKLLKPQIDLSKIIKKVYENTEIEIWKTN